MPGFGCEFYPSILLTSCCAVRTECTRRRVDAKFGKTSLLCCTPDRGSKQACRGGSVYQKGR
eukprot:761867-Hanusia_phi.AAC.1